MRAYYTPEIPGRYHTLAPEMEEDITNISTTLRSFPDVNAPTIAILSGIQRTGEHMTLDWTLGSGGHQDLLEQIVGESRRESVIYHDLALMPASTLRVGALACLGWHGGMPEVVVAGGYYEKSTESVHPQPTPPNEQALRLFGQIVLSSAKTFTDLARNKSCTITIEFKDGYRRQFPTETGTLTLGEGN